MDNIWYEINDSQTNNIKENEAINQPEKNGILTKWNFNYLQNIHRLYESSNKRYQ